ncbi:MAG: type VI secretion system tube protein Hcp [Acidimicrobiia bacterium]
MLTFGYEKATPKLADKLFKGEIIPKLEVEFTATFGGSRATYLRYELKNVVLMNYAIVGEADHGQPGVAFVNSFEEIKVTYTEFDENGKSLGNTEYTYKVGK